MSFPGKVQEQGHCSSTAAIQPGPSFVTQGDPVNFYPMLWPPQPQQFPGLLQPRHPPNSFVTPKVVSSAPISSSHFPLKKSHSQPLSETSQDDSGYERRSPYRHSTSLYARVRDHYPRMPHKKRVTVIAEDGSKHSLSGKRIGRPRVDRENTRCYECDTTNTPQWRFFNFDDLLTCPIPLRAVSMLEKQESKEEDDPNTTHDPSATPDTHTHDLSKTHVPNSTHDPCTTHVPNTIHDPSIIQLYHPSLPGKNSRQQHARQGSCESFLQPGGGIKKVTLCNACWLRVHKAKQKIKAGKRVKVLKNFNSFRSTSSTYGLRTKNSGGLDSNASASFSSTGGSGNLLLPSLSLISDLDSLFLSKEVADSVNREVANVAFLVTETVAFLVMVEKLQEGDVKAEIVDLAPGLRFGGSYQGQPVVIMNDHDFLTLPSITATASPDHVAVLEEAKTKIGSHILQQLISKTRDDVTDAPQEDGKVMLEELRSIQVRLQQIQTEGLSGQVQVQQKLRSLVGMDVPMDVPVDVPMDVPMADMSNMSNTSEMVTSECTTKSPPSVEHIKMEVEDGDGDITLEEDKVSDLPSRAMSLLQV